MYLIKRRTGCGRRIFKLQAQATIEMTVALIASVILIIATAKLFVWLNKCIVDRQAQYENTRTIPRTKIVDFYKPERLELLR